VPIGENVKVVVEAKAEYATNVAVRLDDDGEPMCAAAADRPEPSLGDGG
jgi:hypothetical protein